VLRLEVLFAETARPVAYLVTLLKRARLVSRLGHLARFPQPKVHPAIAFADNLAAAIFRFASSFIRHEIPSCDQRSCESARASIELQ
jgi:hypothetical protein